MNAMDTDEPSVVLSSSTSSGLSVSLHPLPILNVSEHLTRLKLQRNDPSPFVLGALLGTQNGRDVEIVNTFELASEADPGVLNDKVDHGFLLSRRDQYKQVFPSLEFIGWYTVAPKLTARHIAFHEQFTNYCSTPLLLVLQPSLAGTVSSSNVNAQTLPFRIYEPAVEIKERTSRSVYVEVPYSVETGEAERIAVDWTARGGGSGTSLENHLATQRSAVKMLHERILVLVKYVTDAVAGTAKRDHDVLRSLAALVASLPASENKAFREEFDTEYEDVQLTSMLSSLTKSTNILNDLVDKHLLLTASSNKEGGGGGSGAAFRAGRRRGLGGVGGLGGGMGSFGMPGMSMVDWSDRH